MAITLNGTTGITAPALTSDTSFTSDGVSFADGTPANTLVTTTGGNVGIGTSSPSYKLQVAGTIATTSGSAVGGFYSDGTNVYCSTLTNNSLVFEVNGNAKASLDSSGLFKFNSGYGSVATAYGCRAWVNFNGTGTVAIRSSGNVTSITDNGVGLYTMNFTTEMPDTNYAVVGSTNDSANNASLFMSEASPAPTVSAAALRCVNSAAGTGQDPSLMSVSIFS